jgi:predicted PurR-regulated permease PerM
MNVRVTAPSARSGPIVWAGIIASTCVLLFLLQKILWLVVPCLLALLLNYLLQPAMRWVMFRGLKRDFAAVLVMALFLALASGAASAVLPWAAANAMDGQALAVRYLQGGLGLLEHALRALERSSATLAQMHLSAQVNREVAAMTGHVDQYLKPLALVAMTWAPALLLTPFFAFFMLRDGGRFQRMLLRGVPNAFLERTLYLLHEVDRTTRAYFVGLMQLTVLDTLTLAIGLWWVGLPNPLLLGFVCAVLAWLPFIGSVLGGLLVVLVAATDFPAAPAMAYGAAILFLIVRLLDDFVYMPMTVGRSLHMHPLLTVLMIFVGGAVAGIPGLMMVLPLFGIVMVIGATLGRVLSDERLMARFRHARALRRRLASGELVA